MNERLLWPRYSSLKSGDAGKRRFFTKNKRFHKKSLGLATILILEQNLLSSFALTLKLWPGEFGFYRFGNKGRLLPAVRRPSRVSTRVGQTVSDHAV